MQVDSFSKDYPYISSNYEWYQPALGYLPGAILYKIVKSVAPRSLPKDIPPLYAESRQETKNYYSIFQSPGTKLNEIWQDNWGLIVIRVGVGMFGLLVVWATYKIGSSLSNDSQLLGLIASGWVAFLPQFTFINGSIRSDTLGNVFGALLILQCIKTQKKPILHPCDSLLLGALLGLGLLTKYTFLYMLPIPLLAILLRDWKNPKGWLRPWTLIVLTTLSIVGVYLVSFHEARTALSHTFETTLEISPQSFTWDYLRTIPEPLFIDIFFARFGWASLSPSMTWSRIAFCVWSVGFLLTCIHLMQRFMKKDREQENRIVLLLTIGFFLGVLGVLRFNLSAYQPQGRFLFPILAAWGTLGFWGFLGLFRYRISQGMGVLVVGFMLIFNLTSLFGAVLPAYH
jgi:4-amino-4-deoxy-L-arabinose transferase-like glycosyltransferase